MTGTVKLHRVFKAPAERVFKAFLVADALKLKCLMNKMND